VQECVAKRVKTVHIFTAGFSETAKEPGISLHTELARVIKDSNTRVIGPNCEGTYCPETRLTFDTRFSKESGSIGFLSQSGVGGRHLINLANERGLRFSKAISYGNAIDLDGPDFLDYFEKDTATKYILIYIEGVKQGERFFRSLRSVNRTKPVVIIKAGLTESGSGAVASHTASLAGSRLVWQALFRQTGVISVKSLDEAIDQLVAVCDLPHIGGRNVGLVGRGGGFGVIATDMCEDNGLRVPRLTDETREKLAKITPADAGSSVRNPVEIGLGRFGLSEYYAEGINLVAGDPLIDIVISFLNPEDYVQYDIGEWGGQVGKGLIEIAQTSTKPVVFSFMPGRNVDVFRSILQIQNQCQAAGVACYSSLDAAIKAVGKLAAYHEFRHMHAIK